MNIDRINIGSLGVGRTENGNVEQTRAPGNPSRSSAADDSVSLSSRSQEISRLTKAAGESRTEADESRTEKFNRVRQAVESGQYRVSSEEVAKKLIEAHKK